MTYAALIETTGDADVIQWRAIDLPPPGAGEVRIRTTAVGVNYRDIYLRRGLYPMQAMPGVLGSESVGVVEAVGPGVDEFAPGDRVGTFGPSDGAYATERVVRARDLFRLPDTIDDRTAAALLLKGCTTEMLVERCARVQAGEVALVWAAAGGVGQLLVGWLKTVGATVIAVVGTSAKAEIARVLGADHVLLHREHDIAAEVRALTGGSGAHAVFDGVGQASWGASLKATARRGLIVSYGNAGGPVTGVGLGVLAQHGSLFVTRPTLFDYYVTPDERSAGIARVFAMHDSGAIKPTIGQTFRLEDAAAAHRALEAGETEGSTVLLP
jgi:NADPH2:quinone reductase